MLPKFKAVVENNYRIEIAKCVSGPRQWVAETYIIDDNKGNQYFCKIVDKQLLIPGIIKTLPVVARMHELGINSISYPLRAKNGWHCFRDNKLIVIYNYIPANQGFNFDFHKLGQTIAQIHDITSQIAQKPPAENFDFPNGDLFDEQFKGTLTSTSTDPVIKALKKLLSEHEAEVYTDKNELIRLAALCKDQSSALVITHGDLSTNVLIKSPDDIYIIDWDEMRLAPAERDLWMLDERPSFLIGYQSIRPDFQIDKNRRSFCILQYHFENMMLKFTEILNKERDAQERLERVEKLAVAGLAGWRLPKVKETRK